MFLDVTSQQKYLLSMTGWQEEKRDSPLSPGWMKQSLCWMGWGTLAWKTAFSEEQTQHLYEIYANILVIMLAICHTSDFL